MEGELTQPKDYKLDVLVIAHNKIEKTIECINTLYRHTRLPFHLIVVDDSTDLTPLYMNQLVKERDNITYVQSRVPYISGNQIFNKGLAYCKTPYMATVMNSVTVEPDWEMGACQIMDADPKVGVVALKCLFPNGLIESAGIKMYKWLPTDIGRDSPGHRFSLTYEVDAVQWAFAIVRVEACKGVLEENHFHGFRGWDDIDNCLVLKKNGWKCWYCGAGAGYHLPRATRGDDSELAAKENRENAHIFFKRWGFWDDFIKEHPDGMGVHEPPKEVRAK